MIIELTDTTASQVSQALLKARHAAGTPAMGMVLTMVVMCEEKNFEAALADTSTVGREHPSRTVLVVGKAGRKPAMHAQVRVGDGEPGETMILWLQGPVAEHAAGVVLPLLLPDTPVVVWWPGSAPDRLDADSVGALANRRITESTTTSQLLKRAQSTRPGDTDLAWTRLTPWRALLAAALDQYPAQVLGAAVTAQRNSASGALLAAWLRDRLGVDVTMHTAATTGVRDVRMSTAAGDIAITHTDEVLANYAVPGQPLRRVALKRRPVTELLSEELRRMDPDAIYDAATATLVKSMTKPPADKTAASKTPARKPATSKTATKKSSPKKTAAKPRNRTTGKK